MMQQTQQTETLYSELHDALYRWIKTRVNDPSLAEDLVHEVFLKFHERAREPGLLNDAVKIRSYLFRMARNTLIDHYRTRKDHDPLEEGRQRMAWSDGPAEAGEADEPGDSGELPRRLKTDLHDIIESLPAKYADVLCLTDLQEMRYAEAAEKLGLSLSAIKSRVLRGRQLVRQELMARCDFIYDRSGAPVDCEPKSYRARVLCRQDC